MAPFTHDKPARREADGTETALTVAAVGNHDGRYLLVEERIDGSSVMNQPAGHVEPGEDLVTAVIREAREETAWLFEPDAVTGVYLWRHPHKPKQFLRVALGGQWLQSLPGLALDEGIIAAHWYAPAELDSSGIRLRSPMVWRCIHDHLAGNRLPLDHYLSLDFDGLAATALPLQGD